MAFLVLIRHGLTGWNKEGRWQGFTDVPLSEEGKIIIQQAADTIKDIPINIAYTSNLSRTKQTYEELARVLNLSTPVTPQAALNERDYGIYNGKNKWNVEKELGTEEFEKLRKSFDYPIPAGETLRNVYERVVPFYKNQILPFLKAGGNVLVVSSGNTIRALLKYLENISDEDIAKVSLGFGDVYVFFYNEDGQILEKQVRAKELYLGKH